MQALSSTLKNPYILLFGLSLGLGLAAYTPNAHSGESFAEALTGGKPSLYLRYRYENVDEQGFARNAEASTLRTQLGYKTGEFYKFGAFLQFEDVRAIGSERFNSTTNGRTQFPVVADPNSTEVNQAYLSYSGLPGTMLKFGRQAITYDNHRFIGNVGWRQNEQTYDGFTLENKSLPNTTVNYAHVFNVNRIFGENHPTLSDLNLKADFLNVAYSGFKPGKLVGYGYLLDYDTGQTGFPITASNKTFGLRFDGGTAFDGWKLLYTAEYAQQSDYKDGASTVDANYYNAMLGAAIKGVTVKLNYEVLGGDGVYGFATPLATLHAHNGWADRFLNTPRDGIRDAFISIGGSPGWGINLLALYHDFSSDNLNYRYGSEFDIQAVKKFDKNFTVTLKYADYNGATNASNVARNTASGQPRDVRKIWLQGELKF